MDKNYLADAKKPLWIGSIIVGKKNKENGAGFKEGDQFGSHTFYHSQWTGHDFN